MPVDFLRVTIPDDLPLLEIDELEQILANTLGVVSAALSVNFAAPGMERILECGFDVTTQMPDEAQLMELRDMLWAIPAVVAVRGLADGL